jgi:hypothetical protein
MNCRPAPEVTCGSIVPDTCVPVTIVWPGCFPDTDCPRQSDFNTIVGNYVCNLRSRVTTIEESIDLTSLSPTCHDTGINKTVHGEFANIYDVICNLGVGLDTPVTGLTIPACLVEPCGDPFTLGTLLNAMMAKLCCIEAVVPDASGC